VRIFDFSLPKQSIDIQLFMRLVALFALAIIASIAFLGCAASKASMPSSPPPERKATERIEAAPPKASDFAAELSEREKWSRARKTFNRAQREEKSAHLDSAAFYYELTLQYLNAIDLGAIDISMKHVLAMQRKVQGVYDQFLAGLKELPTTTGTQAVLMEVEATPESTAEATDVQPDEMEKEEEADLDTLMVVDRTIQPITLLPPVPVVYNDHVDAAVRFFQGRGRKVMLDWMTRTGEVFPRLRPILREEGLPDELVFLAMIESGLKYKAYSRSRASGIWQFISGTGRLYGLFVSRQYDERRHVEKATRAACRYLRKLHDEFGDWYLALAAYNCGELRIERDIARYKTRDYWRLTRLPKQTRNYVPTYLAARLICENPQKYGFPPLPKEEAWACQTVWVKGLYSLKEIAQAANVSEDEVVELNPEFLRSATFSPYDSVMVRLPTGSSGKLTQGLPARSDARLPDVIEHRIRRGESLSTIAKKYGTTPAEILALADNKSLKPKRLRVGQIVYIPVLRQPQVSAANIAPLPTATAEPKRAPDSRVTYTVQSGQSLSRIAQLLGVSVDELCAWNHIRDRNIIEPGQKLVVRVPSSSAGAERLQKTTPVYHTVQRGETLWKIAQRYGRQTSEILQWNKLSDGDMIYPGQRLLVQKPD
jgi:membrane-bound lytic murein transglycosylase D